MKTSEVIKQLESLMKVEGDCDLVTSVNDKPPFTRLLCVVKEDYKIIIGIFSLVEY